MTSGPDRRNPSPSSASARLREVAGLFTKLGVVGFGGPAAHIALMRAEVVTRRAWMDDSELLYWVGATNLIPRPNSTELAIHLGHQRAGWRGLLAGGVCFIMPAVAIVTALAWIYERYGTDPRMLDARYGILPVIIAVIAHALVGMGRSALTDRFSVALGIAVFAAYLAGTHELALLAAAGFAGAAWASRERWRRPPTTLFSLPILAAGAAPKSLWRLLAVFVEIGSVLYGSGYVLLAFLQRNLVEDLGWVTREQLLDAVAIGQITPGPVFTTATFLGWQIDGPAGAAVATIGIFLPSFLFVAVLARIVPWIRQHPTARAFLSAVTVASLGLMAGVLVELADAALTDVLTVVVGAASLVLLTRTKVNAAWLILGGVLVGAAHAAGT